MTQAESGMPKIILILGPSGVGKTSAYRAVEARFPECVFRHLDGLAASFAHRNGWIGTANVHVLDARTKSADHFLAIGLQAITDLSARDPDRPLVVDVGAGFQNGSYATRLPAQYPTIALVAAPEEVHKRWATRPGNSGALSAFVAREFNAHRMAVYDRCRTRIDTTNLTREQTAEALALALRQLL